MRSNLLKQESFVVLSDFIGVFPGQTFEKLQCVAVWTDSSFLKDGKIPFFLFSSFLVHGRVFDYYNTMLVF